MRKKVSYNLVIKKNKNFFFSKNNDVLIGNWLLEKFHTVLDNKEIKVCTPILNSRSVRKDSYLQCDKIFQSIIKDFVDIMNVYHGINFSLRSWKIIAETWLRRFIYICFNRHKTLKSAFNEFNFNQVFISKNDNFKFFTRDTQALYFASVDENWDSNLFYKIIKFFNFDLNLITDETEDRISNISSIEDFVKKRDLNKNFKNKIVREILNFFRIFTKKNDKIIFQTYLPFITEKYIEISLSQFPTYYKEKFIKFGLFNSNCRERLNFKKSKQVNLENFIRDILPIALPILMVEDFKNILNNNYFNLTKKPKIFFTSTNFENDYLNIFIAKQINYNRKFKYIVGQHGSSYFSDYDSNFRTEVNESDFFFSWGYKNNSKKNIIPFFNFKTYKRRIRCNSNGNLLIVFRSLGYRVLPWDRYYEGLSEVKKIIKMFLLLKKSIQNNTILRLHSNFERSDYLVNKYIKDLNCSIDFGKKKYLDLLKKTRLVCFNYDSTGFLENLSLNIPSLMLSNDIYINKNDFFKKKYEILFKAKLIFDDSKKMSNHINKIWKNIDKWWFSTDVQKAIMRFNNNYNITGNQKDLDKLIYFLKNNS